MIDNLWGFTDYADGHAEGFVFLGVDEDFGGFVFAATGRPAFSDRANASKYAVKHVFSANQALENDVI